ncbi:MAG: PAS domain S-box protein [Bacteroidota bacterium]
MKQNLIVVALTALVVAIVIYLVIDLHNTSTREAISQFSDYQLLIVREMSNRIELYLRTRTQGIQVLSSFASVQYHDWRQMVKDVQAYFNYLKKVSVEAISVLDENGTIIYSTAEKAIGLNYSQCDFWSWATQKENKGKVFVTSLVRSHVDSAMQKGDSTRRAMFSVFLVTPLYQDAKDPKHPKPCGGYAGALVFTLDLERVLTEELSLISPRMKLPQVFVMDKDGTLLFSADHREMVGRNIFRKTAECAECHAGFEHVERVLRQKEGTAEYQLIDRPKRLTAFAPMSFANASWFIGVSVPESEMLGFISRNFRQTLILLTIVIITLVGSSYALYRNYKVVLAARSIRESEEHYRRLVESSPEPMAVHCEGKFVFANPAAAKLLGAASPQELIGKPILDIVHPDYQEKVKDRVQTMIREAKEVPLIEEKFVRLDGQVIDVEVAATPITYGGKKSVQVLAHDITERKRLEEKLSAIYSLSRTMIMMPDEQQIFRAVLTAAQKVLRFEVCNFLVVDEKTGELVVADSVGTEEGIKGFRLPIGGEKGITTVVARTGQPLNIPDVSKDERYVVGGFIGNSELAVPVRSGEKVIGVLNAESALKNAFTDDDMLLLSELAAQSAVALENARLRKNLVESEAKYHSIVEESLVGVYIIQDAVFKYVNQRFCEIFGYAYDEIVERLGPFDLTYPEDRPTVAENIRRRLTGEVKSVEYQFRAVRKDGEIFPVKVLGVVSLYQGKPAIIGTLLDLSKEEILQQQLIQAQKMESMGRLAGGIAHDFNNVLAAVLGSAEMIARRASSDEKLSQYVSIIRSAAQRGADLAKRLLAFARMETYEMKPLSVNKVLNETVKLLEYTFEKSVEIETRFADNIPIISGDAGQLQQVFMNICINARDAMPRGGKLTIETRRVAGSEVPVESFMKALPGDYVEIRISDTGVGMDEKTRQRIFEPFFTTKERGKGTGLGLAVAYGIVRSHNGFTTVESTLGVGTTLKVYLPASESRAEAEVAKEQEEIPGGSETILFVDDEDMVREMGEELLTGLGYRVLQAGSGEEAIELYRVRGKDIHLVILDLAMPKMDGEETFRRLKEIDPAVKVLIASGLIEPEPRRKMEEAGVAGFLLKPYRVGDLARTIREVLKIGRNEIGQS